MSHAKKHASPEKQMISGIVVNKNNNNIDIWKLEYSTLCTEWTQFRVYIGQFVGHCAALSLDLLSLPQKST